MLGIIRARFPFAQGELSAKVALQLCLVPADQSRTWPQSLQQRASSPKASYEAA